MTTLTRRNVKLSPRQLAEIALAGLATFDRTTEDGVLVFRAASFETVLEALIAAERFEQQYGWTCVVHI